MSDRPESWEAPSGGQWWPWLLGGALLAAVIGAVARGAEPQAFVRLVEQAEPAWLLGALALQAGTYSAQGGIWRLAARSCAYPLGRRDAFTLSLAKLFVDQALPSGGLSSSVLVAQALERRRLPAAAVNASVLINVASYHLAYALALVAALGVIAWRGQLNAFVAITAGAFLVFSALVSAAVFLRAGRPGGPPRRVARWRVAQTLVHFLTVADGALVRDARVEAQAIGLQGAIILCDAATLWTLIAALGGDASAGGVFASFMIASLFRTMGIVPGGLGTFEASSVLMLRLTGVDLAVALAATLLFRGCSFWLPMVPGWWAARHVLRPVANGGAASPAPAYWAMDLAAIGVRLGASGDGLTADAAARRLADCGPNELRDMARSSRRDVLVRQFRSPLLLLLVFAAVTSASTGEWIDAGVVLTIVVLTAGIGYSREYRAERAVAALRARLGTRCTVMRDGRPTMVPARDVVPGDVILLAAGSLVPADAILIDATDFFVSEAVLTGESYPVQKRPGPVAATAEVGERTNCVFLGTNVRSGSARGLVVATGGGTEFGAIAAHLTLRPPDTEFDRGIRRFGYVLTTAMLAMVLLVFAVHVVAGRPPVETLLFAVALAVGLSPELLPAILGVNLARGARQMAARGVLVRHLNAIENLGSMDVLCTDKTGTLTEGVVQLDGAYDAAGAPSDAVLELAAWNAALESGVASPLDDAILAVRASAAGAPEKLAEIPFDFVRKRVTVVVADGPDARLVTKGAYAQVVEACASLAGGPPLDDAARARLDARYDAWTGEGVRVLAVASRRLARRLEYRRDDERELVFEGFLTFLDRPKPGVREAIADLSALGVSLKLISGDSRRVAEHVAGLVGLGTARVLTGRDLDELHDEALWREAGRTDIFAEVDPNQKERIILALKKTGHVVGFLGDGVNDAPAMHAADTSLSVDTAVDVARDAADFVLLERGLQVIRDGIVEGRRTFANTQKYLLTTASANLGNMTSMAAASLVLPFLPLTAGQILLNNFLSDVPAVGIADDRVDPEMVDRPRRWDMRFIGAYMVQFGLLSAVFDAITFGVLLWWMRATPDVFRTAWFVESLLTELAVALVMRTRRRCYQSRPGTVLLATTLLLVPFALAIPVLPFARAFGFVPLPASLLAAVGGITLAYVAATEVQKAWFYRTRP